MSEAIADISAQYDLALSPKLMALVRLLAVSAGIYAPRVIVEMSARKVKRESEPQNGDIFQPGTPLWAGVNL